MTHSFAYGCVCTVVRCHLNLSGLGIRRRKSVGNGLQYKLQKVCLRSLVYIWQQKPTLFKSLDYSTAMPWGKNTLHSQTGIYSKMTANLQPFLY